MWQLLFFVSLQCAGRKSPARQVCRKFLYLMLIVSCTVNDAWCLDFSVSLHPCFFILFCLYVIFLHRIPILRWKIDKKCVILKT